MSWTGKCGDCGTAALYENIHGLLNLTHPEYETAAGPMVRQRWRQGIAAAVGARLDDRAGAD